MSAVTPTKRSRRLLTLVKIYAQMPPFRQRIHVHKISFRILKLFALLRQLLLCKCPVSPLGGFPVASRHRVCQVTEITKIQISKSASTDKEYTVLSRSMLLLDDAHVRCL